MNQISKICRISPELWARCEFIDRLESEIDAHKTDDPCDDFVDVRTHVIDSILLEMGRLSVNSGSDAIEMLARLERYVDIYKDPEDMHQEDKIVLGIIRSVKAWIERERACISETVEIN